MLLLLQLLVSISIGTTLGIITGLIPGIHINLIALSILTLSPFFLQFTTPLLLAIIIVAMAVTHTFLDTIPSIFFGAPDSDNILSVLPGHKLLLEGKGYEAVTLTVIGSLASLILCVSFLPILLQGIKIFYPFIKDKIGYILLVTSCILILKERKEKFWALIIFILAGVLGIIVLTSPFIKNPLFPLLSGLFGTSALIISYSNNTKIPKQNIAFPQVGRKEGLQAVSTAVITGSVCSTLPGLGPSQAAIIGSQWMRKSSAKSFLILIGGLNTVNMIASFITLYIIQKARNGAVITISRIMEGLTLTQLLLLIAATMVTAGIATLLALNITKIFAKIISKINYKKLCIGIISIITLLVIFLSGLFGIFILLVATCLGMLPPLKNVGRNHLMGCLLIPIILFFLL